MKRLIIVLSLLTLLAVPTPRCHVEVERGRAWLVCPCKVASWGCTDHWRITRYRGRL